jgi:hypothetical protein
MPGAAPLTLMELRMLGHERRMVSLLCSTHSIVALVVAALIVLPDADRFIASQNTCLFRESNDLSSSVDRTADDECMAGRGYVLMDDCPATATKRSCYDHKP